MIKWFWDSGFWIVCVGFVLIGFIFYGASVVGEKDRKAIQEWTTWSYNCIESGGVPVTINAYLKGIGQGEMCVKISEKIDVNTK